MKLGPPLIVGCAIIASMVLVQATAITAIIRLVRFGTSTAVLFFITERLIRLRLDHTAA